MTDLFSLFSELAGIAGFALSALILIRDWRREKQCFSFDVIDYSSQGASSRFYVCIVNRSRSPLVITSFSCDETTCELEPKKIRGNPQEWNFRHTPRFPLAIEAQGARLVYLEFVKNPHRTLDRGTPVTFQIQTTVRSARRTVLLGRKQHYLNTSHSSQ